MKVVIPVFESVAVGVGDVTAVPATVVMFAGLVTVIVLPVIQVMGEYPTAPAGSAAVIHDLKVPRTVGVPVITPVAVFKVRPVGSPTPEKVYLVTVVSEPEPTRGILTAVPTGAFSVPLGEVLMMFGVPVTIACESAHPLLSLDQMPCTGNVPVLRVRLKEPPVTPVPIHEHLSAFS